MSGTDVEPTVTVRAVRDLIEAQIDESVAGRPETVEGIYRQSGAYEVLVRLETAVVRLKEETLKAETGS